ncbi:MULTISPECIES: Clp protease N-terminal domain-containing protein [Nocardia]|uniref:Clp protease N-terminal domain-containing protein n=1 Tax=Nocardia TaxID=1817 RepID=UPI001892EAC1|nr:MULTISPECIES: Clp protease N-terminal domain-containing protein [Nocardia]MBF6352663.1 Clp protease [Nocardia flavorosea]
MFERFTKSARSAVVAAQEHARELRSPDIRVEHLLLGVLEEAEPELRSMLERNGIAHDTALNELTAAARAEPLGAEDAAALRSIGIDLDAVRESLEATFGADALDRAISPEESRRLRFGHIPFSREAKKALELALREAVARKDKTIESGHILLAVLRTPTPATTELLGGADALTGLREQVHTHLDRAA